MNLTTQEMLAQYDAMKQTVAELAKRKPDLEKFFAENKFERIIFTGCGSGYCLAKSGALSASIHSGLPGVALPAGDLWLQLDQYAPILDQALIIAPSRSGSTSEVVRALEAVRAKHKVKILSISGKSNSDLSKIGDFSIDLPWIFDHSVCQTRCVSNLYVANLMVLAAFGGNQALWDDAVAFAEKGNAMMEQNYAKLNQIGETEFQNVVILADAECAGLADEGVMALKEIAQLDAAQYHFLDVRHGPMAMIGAKSLVLTLIPAKKTEHHSKLLEEMNKIGARVVTVGVNEEITVPESKFFPLQGLGLIFAVQAIALKQAEIRGLDPDHPRNLVAWVKL